MSDVLEELQSIADRIVGHVSEDRREESAAALIRSLEARVARAHAEGASIDQIAHAARLSLSRVAQILSLPPVERPCDSQGRVTWHIAVAE